MHPEKLKTFFVFGRKWCKRCGRCPHRNRPYRIGLSISNDEHVSVLRSDKRWARPGDQTAIAQAARTLAAIADCPPRRKSKKATAREEIKKWKKWCGCCYLLTLKSPKLTEDGVIKAADNSILTAFGSETRGFRCNRFICHNNLYYYVYNDRYTVSY